MEAVEAMSEVIGNGLLQAAIDNAGVSIMMCDRDLRITYANRSTIALLQKNRGEFDRVYPGFSVDNLVGTCIDVFHKNPAHQRQILSDPKNLPHRADIEVGKLTFALNITGMFGENGEYVGNCLEWANVTDTRRKLAEYEGQIKAIGKAQAVIEFELDGTILHVNDNFLATTGYGLDEIKGKHHSMFVEESYGNSMDYRQCGESLNL